MPPAAILFSLFASILYDIICVNLNQKIKPLIHDSEYNVIHQLEKKADFLYSAMEKYIRDAEKDNKPELVKLWNMIKEDEQNHLKMLRTELSERVSEN